MEDVLWTTGDTSGFNDEGNKLWSLEAVDTGDSWLEPLEGALDWLGNEEEVSRFLEAESIIAEFENIGDVVSIDTTSGSEELLAVSDGIESILKKLQK